MTELLLEYVQKFFYLMHITARINIS